MFNTFLSKAPLRVRPGSPKLFFLYKNLNDRQSRVSGSITASLKLILVLVALIMFNHNIVLTATCVLIVVISESKLGTAEKGDKVAN